MKSKSLFLMAVSLGFGLIAAIGISQVLGRNGKAEAPAEEVSEVIVPLEVIDIGKEIQEDMLRVEKWPTDLVPHGAIGSVDEVVGKVNRVWLGKDIPIQNDALIDKSEAGTLSIPDNYKVIGIKVAADDHIHGLLRPGDLVDIIGIFRGQGPGGTPLSKTFLENIRVFSVDSSLVADSGSRDAEKRNTAIVSVLATKKQAEALVLVQRSADLKLVLRGKPSEAIDYDKLAMEEPTGETTLQSIIGNETATNNMEDFWKNMQNLTPPPQADDKDEFTMRIVTGSGVQYVTFDADGNIKTDEAAQEEQPAPARPSNPGAAVLPISPDEINAADNEGFNFFPDQADDNLQAY